MRRLALISALALTACDSKPSKPVEPAAVPTPPVPQEVVPVKVADSLEVSLVPSKSAYPLGKGMELRLRVRNPTTKPLRFCTYHTLFEGLRNDIFDVTGPAGDVKYRGMMAKRAPPTEEDYLSLAPGAQVDSQPVDLGEGYAFDKAGKYTVVFPGGGISGLGASAPLELTVTE